MKSPSKKRLPTLPVIRKIRWPGKNSPKNTAPAQARAISKNRALSRSVEMVSRIDEIDDVRGFMQRFAKW